MTAAFTALAHAAHRAAAFATPGAGVVTAETATAFMAAVVAAVAGAAPAFVLTFAVFVKSKHSVSSRFHVAKIYL
jgi:hypothetical protein